MNPSERQLLGALHGDSEEALVGVPGTSANIILSLDTSAVATILTRTLLVLSNLTVLTVTGSAETWSAEMADLLQGWISRIYSIQIYNREVVDASCNGAARITSLFSDGREWRVSSLRIPLNELGGRTSEYALRLPNLVALTIRAPPSCLQFDITDTIAFLSSFSDLRMVSLTISTDSYLEEILTALQMHHPMLRRLALLTCPISRLIPTRGERRLRFENQLIRGLEAFTQLEHIILDECLASPMLDEALDRLPFLHTKNWRRGPFTTESEDEISRALRASLPRQI